MTLLHRRDTSPDSAWHNDYHDIAFENDRFTIWHSADGRFVGLGEKSGAMQYLSDSIQGVIDFEAAVSDFATKGQHSCS